MKKTLFIALSILLVIFCLNSFKPSNKKSNKLIGIWVRSEFGYLTAKYVKSDSLKENEPGFEFKEDGKLIIRQNIGWCGTPPVKYGNYNGTWHFISNNTLRLNHDNWRGKVERDLKIIKLTDKNIELKSITYMSKEK